jgi:hypothetical protein
MKPEIACVILVIQDNKVLLGKRKGGRGDSLYAPPGGKKVILIDILIILLYCRQTGMERNT